MKPQSKELRLTRCLEKQHALKMDGSAKMHLKEWLVAQVESERYEGLCWVDEAKSMFRIPWKHAAKKDYKQREDAALFKAWAVYKGKYREGRDKADPTMWKTRLRCALNKSTDFQEVPERNQLDITEPYKVYRVLQEAEVATAADTTDPVIVQARKSPRSPVLLNKESEDLVEVCEENEKTLGDELMREHMYCDLTEKSPRNQRSAPLNLITPMQTISDFRMQVKLLYRGQCVMRVTTRSSEGCFILQGRVPMGNERIYGTCTAQQLSFPDPSSIPLPADVVETMSHLLCHLERGVLLWVAPEGVYIKRFCQGRVYWGGPAALHADRPNKLEREKTFKLLDMPAFLKDLQSCLQGKGPVPVYTIELCFGEEYPDPKIPKSKKLIMAQVVPMFAVELLRRFNLQETEEKRPTLTTKTDT